MRRLLATTATGPLRWKVFGDAAERVAVLVAKGLDQGDASEELRDMALAQGFLSDPGEEAVEEVMLWAFQNVEIVPSEMDDRPSKNGKANGHQGEPTLSILSKADFIGGFKPPSYLIDGMLQRRFIYSLTGATGHAKTAIALLLAELVSSQDPNTMLLGHRVKSGRVVYFVGENPDDVRMRVIGASSKRDDDHLTDKIFFIPGMFNIEKMFDVLANEMVELGSIDLIIVDTSAAYFLGNEELSNTQMGNHARMLRRLTTLNGRPCVLVLCHPIKHASEPHQLLPRGGGAFLAEVDGNLTAWKTDDLIVLHHNKIRGPGFEPISFELDRISTDSLLDDDGRRLPTVRAVAISEIEEQTQADRKVADENLLLSAMLKESGQTIAGLATACRWLLQGGDPHKSKVDRIIKRLEDSRLVKKERDKWELTEKGKSAARATVVKDATAKEVKKHTEEKFRTVGKAAPGSVCVACHSAEGDVFKIKDGNAGSKPETLHEGCAVEWYNQRLEF